MRGQGTGLDNQGRVKIECGTKSGRWDDKRGVQEGENGTGMQDRGEKGNLTHLSLANLSALGNVCKHQHHLNCTGCGFKK